MSTLELQGIEKRFGAVDAVRGADLTVSPGIHAVVGENGAGKSTLLKIAAGLLEPDRGQVRIDGTALAPHTAAEAIRRGVAMVQQHFALIDVFTGLENLVLGREPTTGWFGTIDFDAARASALRVGAELGVELPLDVRVEKLGVGDRQRLEIARALLRDAKILILDEPTAVLAPAEADALYATLARLAKGGRAIVVVTHKLDEVEAHAERVTVMRRGQVVCSDSVRDVTPESLARAIMGGDLPAKVAHGRPPAGDARLVVEGVSLGPRLRGVSLEVRAGEVVGIAGIEGNGQRELVRVLAGLEPPDAGTVRGPTQVSVVHEERQVEGLVLDAPVEDNLLLGELDRFVRFDVLDAEEMRRVATERARRFEVSPPDLALPARALSGGNQQKIVVARAIARAGADAVLVVAHPTRGVDLGATRAIHAQLLDAARAGTSVLVVSADLEELRTLSDRILVMARGRIVAELPKTSSDAEIGAKMIGAHAGTPIAEGPA